MCNVSLRALLTYELEKRKTLGNLRVREAENVGHRP